MTPYTELVTELVLALRRAEASAALLRTAAARGARRDWQDGENHRIAVLAELLDALDKVELTPADQTAAPMGTRFLTAMHPYSLPEASDA